MHEHAKGSEKPVQPRVTHVSQTCLSTGPSPHITPTDVPSPGPQHALVGHALQGHIKTFSFSHSPHTQRSSRANSPITRPLIPPPSSFPRALPARAPHALRPGLRAGGQGAGVSIHPCRPTALGKLSSDASTSGQWAEQCPQKICPRPSPTTCGHG